MSSFLKRIDGVNIRCDLIETFEPMAGFDDRVRGYGPYHESLGVFMAEEVWDKQIKFMEVFNGDAIESVD
jgi:hypothetical protein